jgi:type IV secretion system protein TrbL
VFVFLTWHIPSVAGSMMAGAVSLSLADAVYPAIWGSRAAGAGVIAAGAVGGAAVAAGRWGVDRLRVHTSLHSANGQLSPTQPATASVSTAPTPPSSSAKAGNQGQPEPKRPKESAQAGLAQTPESQAPRSETSGPPDSKGTI